MNNLVNILKNLSKEIKILILLFGFVVIVIIIFSFKTNVVTEQGPIIEDIDIMTDHENLLGGWQEAKEETMSEGLIKIFEDATITDKKNTYEPIKLLASQVVAGFNYKFLANVINNETGEKSQYYVFIFTDLDGKSVLKNIHPVEK